MKGRLWGEGGGADQGYPLWLYVEGTSAVSGTLAPAWEGSAVSVPGGRESMTVALESHLVLTLPLTCSCDLGRLLTPQNLVFSVPGGRGSPSEPSWQAGCPLTGRQCNVRCSLCSSEQGRGSRLLGLERPHRGTSVK